MTKDNKNKQDLDYYNEVLEDLDRLRRQTINRCTKFKSISNRCKNTIDMAIDNAMLFINHYKDILEYEINGENKEH